MNTTQKIMAVLFGATVLFSGATMAQSKSKKAKKMGDSFYVFKDRGSRDNHYIPSGWMGDYGDIKLNPGWTKGVKKPLSKLSKQEKTAMKKKDSRNPDTCIQVKYSAERKQGAGWAGIYWQHPANNWGDKRGGFDLSKYTKMTFWAKGEAGGETIDKFFVGGITGQTEEGDSDEASISPVELTKSWERYEIDLKGLDLSHIIGGFGFAANADANPDGFVIYIDEISFKKS